MLLNAIPREWLQWVEANKWSIVGGVTVGSLALWGWKWLRGPKLPPGPRGWPIVGNLPEVSKTGMHLYFMELGKKYGDIFTVRLGPTPMIVLNSYAAIKEAFVEQNDTFSDRPPMLLFDHMNFYDDIFTPRFDKNWIKNKKMIAGALRKFGVGASIGIEEKIQDETDKVITYLEQNTSVPLDMEDILSRACAAIVYDVILGMTYDIEDPALADLTEKVRDWYMYMTSAAGLYIFLPDWVSKIVCYQTGKKLFEKTEVIRAMLRKHATDHLATLDETQPRDFIDMYKINKGEDFDFEKMVNTLFLLLPDGIDTMAAALNWAVLYLILYPGVQMKVQSEIDDVVGSNVKVTLKDKPRLPYTQAFIMEVLRIAAPVVNSGLHCTLQHGVKLRGYDIPRNFQVIAHTYGACRDPETYKDPDSFHPERFIDEDGKLVINDQWMPFGLGRRTCIGEKLAQMELFILVTNMCRVFSFTCPEETDQPTTKAIDMIVVSKPTPFKAVLKQRGDTL